MDTATPKRKSSGLLLLGKILLHTVVFVVIAKIGGKVGTLFCKNPAAGELTGTNTTCSGELFSASLLCGLLSLVYVGWVLKNPVTRFFAWIFPVASSWRVLLPRSLGFVLLIPGVWFAFYILVALSVTISCSAQLNTQSSGSAPSYEGCGMAGFGFGIWAGFIGTAIYCGVGLVILISRLLGPERA